MKYRLEIDREVCSYEFNYPEEGLINILSIAAHWAKKDFNKITILDNNKEIFSLVNAGSVPSLQQAATFC